MNLEGISMDKKQNSQKQKWHNTKRNDRQNDQSGLQKKKFPPNQGKKPEQLQQIELDTFICPRCSQPITDLPSALADKSSGAPVHFDCVLQFLQNAEELKQNEKITYIGQGRFAVTFFENPHDLRKFSIVRLIEWEDRDKAYDWRETISGLYSQVK